MNRDHDTKKANNTNDGAGKMALLTIDLGTKCGWCLRSGSNTVSGVWDLKGGRYEGGGMRFVRFRSLLEDLWLTTVSSNSIKLIVYEEVRRHMGVDAAHVYGGLQAVLTSWCEDRPVKIPYEGVPVGTIKKYVTGKGNADKAAMIAAVRKFGFEPADDNEADAIALMLLKLEAPGIEAFL